MNDVTPREYWVGRIKRQTAYSLACGVLSTALLYYSFDNDWLSVIGVIGVIGCFAFSVFTVNALDAYWILRAYSTDDRWPDSESNTFSYGLDQRFSDYTFTCTPTLLFMVLLTATPIAISIVLAKI